MALYDELPVFGDVYRLTLRVFTLTQGFNREFKYTLGQEMKRDCLVLLRSIYRINRSRERVPLLEAFLDDFELLKLEVRLCADLKLVSLRQHAELIEMMATIGRQITGWRNASMQA
ncbi:MAG: four helix bundle protein [Actinobacteria bacterium]|nr:four helix bundle protein [Actinomycetota bacterium]